MELERESLDPSENLQESPQEFTLPVLSSEYMPTEDLVEHLTKRSRTRFEAKRSREWIPIKVNVKGPVGVTFFGDPHIDDDYCDWDALRSDIQTINRTECLWAVNLGDVSNNWIGRLQRLMGTPGDVSGSGLGSLLSGC